MGMVRKGLGNVPLKDLTMERKRVDEFEESLFEDFDSSNYVNKMQHKLQQDWIFQFLQRIFPVV